MQVQRSPFWVCFHLLTMLIGYQVPDETTNCNASHFAMYLVTVQKSTNLVEIKACEKFYHRHIVDIPRIKF